MLATFSRKMYLNSVITIQPKVVMSCERVGVSGSPEKSAVKAVYNKRSREIVIALESGKQCQALPLMRCITLSLSVLEPTSSSVKYILSYRAFSQLDKRERD